MEKKAFNSEKFSNLISEELKERINKHDKLYIEIGGKLIRDRHAFMVLPGFEENAKFDLFAKINHMLEVIIVISAEDLSSNVIRTDTKEMYVDDIMNSIELFQSNNIDICGVVVTMYDHQKLADQFINKLNNINIKAYKHYKILTYPDNHDLILSDEGFGLNEHVITQKKVILVTAPGAKSGKLATSMSQVYNDSTKGIKSGYAKLETFPIWNLPIEHPVNQAYEAATSEIGDYCMLDKLHLEDTGIVATSYNRDVIAFPLVKATLEKSLGKSPYNSPTQMCVNLTGFAIEDDEATRDACKKEILRRYHNALFDYQKGRIVRSTSDKIRMVLKRVGLKPEDRLCVATALKHERITNQTSVAIELNDEDVMVAEGSKLLTAGAVVVLRLLTKLANLDDRLEIIPKNIIEAVVYVKKDVLKVVETKAGIYDILHILSISKLNNPLATLLLEQCVNLAGIQLHSTDELDEFEIHALTSLKVNFTMGLKKH